MGSRTFRALLFGLACFRFSLAQSRQCSYTQNIQPGSRFKVNNPSYPNPYPSDTRCSWTAYTEIGLQVEVSCGRVQLAKNSNGLCLDHLMIVIDDEAIPYCAPFNVSANRIVMRLTATTTWSGYFNCVFEVAARPTPPVFENLPPLVVALGAVNPPSGSLEICDCGSNKKSQTSRVVGGVEAELHEFPSMVAFVNRNSRSLWCGATIIAPSAVLTAAHCTVGRDPADYALLVGEHDTSRGSETETSLVRVTKFISHADYNARTQAYDLAIALTEQPLTYNNHVGPACLPFDFQVSVNDYLTVTGWGLDSFGGFLSKVLKKADVKIVRPEYCTRTYNEYNPEKHICTYERGKDACQYDSGGPLYAYNRENKQFLMGVVSYGRDCGKTDPAVNSNVTSYIDWIQAQLPDEVFCRMKP